VACGWRVLHFRQSRPRSGNGLTCLEKRIIMATVWNMSPLPLITTHTLFDMQITQQSCKPMQMLPW